MRPTPAIHRVHLPVFLSRCASFTKKSSTPTDVSLFSIASCDVQVRVSTTAHYSSPTRRTASAYSRPVTTSLLNIRTPQTS